MMLRTAHRGGGDSSVRTQRRQVCPDYMHTVLWSTCIVSIDVRLESSRGCGGGGGGAHPGKHFAVNQRRAAVVRI